MNMKRLNNLGRMALGPLLVLACMGPVFANDPLKDPSKAQAAAPAAGTLQKAKPISTAIAADPLE
jgi:hypothetical protein